MADKWHNLTSILMDLKTVGDAVYDRFIIVVSTREEKKALTLWFYDSLIKVYETKGIKGVQEVRELFEAIRTFTA